MSELKKFNDQLFKNVISNPTEEELRNLSKHMEKTTEFNSASYVTEVRNRSAKNTYIVDEIEVGVDQKEISKEEADKVLQKVIEYVKDKDVVRVDRQMGMGDKFSYNCRLYISKEYARIAYMWNNTLQPSSNPENPDLLSIYIPEWPERIMIAYPETGLTLILGSDYFGEAKKSFLRMAMYKVKEEGGLGFHAGSKLLRVYDKNHELKDVGFIMFGLSGTGKTTLTIHDHGLTGEEKSIVRQDDVIFMDENGYCVGTETGFFIKTEGLNPEQQGVLYKAATTDRAILENVKVYDDGKVDFDDVSLTSNGRGIILRSEVPNTDDTIDLEKANKLVNKMFYIDREIVGGKILIEDLKGSDIFFEDEVFIGNIQDVQDYGAAEVFFVKTHKGTEIMFPNVKGVIASFDYKQKKLVVNKEKFGEVCDYEN